MFETTDQLNKKVVLAQYPPRRIVSLVPSQTELLADLGLDTAVVGITKFCVHPRAWFRNKTRVGGTKNIHIETISSLNPDLIIANKEENVKEQVEALEAIAPVWVSNINNLDEALDMIHSVGVLVDAQMKAATIAGDIRQQFAALIPYKQFALKTAYLIWRNPYMTVGGDTFIHDMLKRCGLLNVFENEKRYPETSLQRLKEQQVQLILLSSEPYPFKAIHADEIRSVLPDAHILQVNGEMFSWYGSRLLYAAQYFKELTNKINEPPCTTGENFRL